MRYALPAVILGFILFGCKNQKNVPFGNYQISKSLIEDSAMVVSAHPLATRIGLDILSKGGNAVDASIAIQFALAVCYPEAGNIGGGGFMVYRSNEGDVLTLDYREMAPSRSSAGMYLDEKGNAMTEKSQYGPLASGVPGSVAGMYEAFTKYSKLKNWKILVQPAIDVARNGFELTEKEARQLNENAADFQKVNQRKTIFNERVWAPGDVFVQLELAKTLEAIRDHGRDGFYKGEVAAMIQKEMEQGSGYITMQDLAAYKAVWRPAVSAMYRGYKVYSMPPPSSGGIALIQLLKSVEPYDVKSMGMHTPALVHLMVEAERRVYADRAVHLGDSDFYPVPVNKLTDSLYIRKRMADFVPQMATSSKQVLAGSFPESEQTTHLCVVDASGNAVSVTTTLNDSYGSHLVVDGAGFILNNEMDDFSIKPGVANIYGLIGGEANKIEPGKRMLSSMTPTIIEKDGKLKMVVGTPGGSTIITSVFQTIINVLDFGMDASEAVAAPRFHHQWLPDSIQLESSCLSTETRKKLATMGHAFKSKTKIGQVEAIVVMGDGRLQGGADTRGDDDVKGF